MLRLRSLRAVIAMSQCVSDETPFYVIRRSLRFSCIAWLALGGMLLAGCGGDQKAVTVFPKENARAQRVVEASDVPNLIQCVNQLSIALKKQANSVDVNLHCVAGTYQGETSEGRKCSLKIDDDQPGFQFQVERERVDIRWEKVAYAADGSPVHNLEDSSVPGQPGVQLTRFSGAQMPLTEALIMRIGAGAPVLPQMIYQHTLGSTTKTVRCVFGK